MLSESVRRPLSVAVLGPAALVELVPTDAGIERRRATPDDPGGGSSPADVLIVDLDEGGVGIDAIARAWDPDSSTVIVATARDPARATSALAAGATDFALLPRDGGWLRAALLRERDRRRRHGGEGAPDGAVGAVPDRLVVEIPSAGLSYEGYERRFLEHALWRAGWNRSRAARELGISRPRLLRKIERYGLEPP